MKQRKKGRPRKKPSKEEFEMLYYNNSITIYELAELWKVTPGTIYKWASEFRKEDAK